MRYIAFTILFLVHCFCLHAQPQLCISKGTSENSIEFNAAEVNNYLQADKYKVVFFGERHNASFDPEIKYHLVLYLNKYCGIRDFFMEMGFAAAWHFNQYLLTGDTAFIGKNQFIYTYGDYRMFWRRLYELNQQLPDSLKLVIHGVDFERTEVFETLMALAPKDKTLPASLKQAFDTIAAHVTDKQLNMYEVVNGKVTGLTDNSDFTNTLDFIKSQLLKNIDQTRTYYDNNFHVVYDIITNKSKAVVKPKPRNRTMIQAIARITEQEKIKKFAGFFGAMHTGYNIPFSLANSAAELPGIEATDILNITEIIDNLPNRDNKPIKLSVKNFDIAATLTPACKATILPGSKIPGFKKMADFVIVADNAK